jgi:transposase
VKDSYLEDKGRPSIDSVVLIKIPLIQYLFGIRSMRQTIKEIETNVEYRWFLGFDFHDPIPHFSTFGKNYERRFKNSNLFEQIFSHILSQAIEHGFVHTE